MIDTSAPAASVSGAGGPAPRFYGVTSGLVTDIDDPEKLGRVRLRLPWLSDDLESAWARLVTPMAGADRGLFLLPDVDEEVLVAFEHGDLDRPLVVGGLWNAVDRPPVSAEEPNNVRLLKSRSGHVLLLDDHEDAPRIEIVDAGGRNRITIETKNDRITISAGGDLDLVAEGGTITLRAARVRVAAHRDVAVQTDGSMDLTASGRIDIKGANVDIH